jgi:6-pyruvoyltetrahydropterin/6-carboxytetrahydropterin synthase
MPGRSQFKVSVTKDNIVFASAHFITFRGHRCETLHGHNYRTRVSVEGGLDPETAFVIDFAALKQLMKRLVDEIDHRVLLPLENAKLQITEEGDSVAVAYEGVRRYVFPKRDCVLLPMPNTTVEMLAQYLAVRARRELEQAGGDAVELTSIEVEVEENFGQSATYRESLA